MLSNKPTLVGQYDSPFVRRVAVVLHHYGVVFERRVHSTFTDFEAMPGLGPFGKVPVFILPDGERLWDSRAILDHLHGETSPERMLLIRSLKSREFGVTGYSSKSCGGLAMSKAKNLVIRWVITIKAAKGLGLTIPQSLLIRADRVVE